MAFKKTTHDMSVVFEDEFLADEILTRLPARCAVRCTVLSKSFRQLLASSHFWLRHQRLGAPLELPHAARLRRHDAGRAFSFHVAGPTFVMEHAVNAEQRSWYAGTCNGLVLVSSISCPDKGQSSVGGLVFNPTTKQEARMSLQLRHPGKEDVRHRILGFGYGPSSKVYKALILEAHDYNIRLMVASLGGSGGQEPRTVFSSSEDMDCNQSVRTADGKVYFLIDTIDSFENWDMSVLVFDVDSEAVTRIAIPEWLDVSTGMLEVYGRPCIWTQKGQDTVIWLLTVDHRWEQLHILVKESSRCNDHLNGVWTCGDGLLFAEFEYSGAYMYNLHKATREEKESGIDSRLAAVSALKIEYKLPKLNCWMNLWDYKPTLISPASIFGDAAFSARGCESVAPKHEVDGTFLEMTKKCVVDPMMHMLSLLCPQSS